MEKKLNTTNLTFLIVVGTITSILLLSGCTQQPINPGQNTVLMQNSAFNPKTLTVSNGTTVIWKNNDNVGHDVVEDNGLFNSGTLSKGQNFSYTFTVSGTYDYYCSIHPGMNGKIIVQ